MERTAGITRRRLGTTSPLLVSKQEAEVRRRAVQGNVNGTGDPSRAILNAFGDDFSRRILTSATATGRTVEEISAEQNLPLSTCYRRVASLLGAGLMILERLVVTPTGKRYAVYRTSFSDATIRFDGREIAVEVTPNMDIIDKLRRRWLSANYPSQNQSSQTLGQSGPRTHLMGTPTGQFQ